PVRRGALPRSGAKLARCLAPVAVTSAFGETAMLASAVFITCAVTGSGDSVRKNAHVPVTPEQIATSALEAHEAGAAIVHVHVRDPASGAPSRDPALFREVFERIRARNREVIVNLTGGMGGDLMLGPDESPLDFGRGTDFVGPRERIAHIIELEPEIGSLDCGSLNFDESLYGTTPRYLRSMAQAYRSKRIRPEIEVFELGHIELARQLMAEGLIEQPALFQLCLGIKYGAPATAEARQQLGLRRYPLAAGGPVGKRAEIARKRIEREAERGPPVGASSESALPLPHTGLQQTPVGGRHRGTKPAVRARAGIEQ